MKRSSDKPFLRSEGEMKDSMNRQYDMMLKQPGKINSVFTERPHYGIPKPTKEAANEQSQ